MRSVLKRLGSWFADRFGSRDSAAKNSGNTGVTSASVATRSFSFDATEQSILLVLRNSTRLLVVADIAARTDLSGRTIGPRLNDFIGKGLVHRPRGMVRGVELTDLGRRIVEGLVEA